MNKTTKEIILEKFDYLPDSGNLIWKKCRYSKFVGTLANKIDSRGYGVIKINGVRFRAHRIVFFLETGEWPEQVDHINGDTLDNRICNLRASDKRKNQQNRWHHREGTLVGASYAKDKKKWRSQIQINHERVHLGYYLTEQEAHERYLRALRDQ